MKRVFSILVLSIISASTFGQNSLKIEGKAFMEDGTVMYRTNFSIIRFNPLTFSEVDYSLGAYVNNDVTEYFILMSLNDKIAVAENNCLKLKIADDTVLNLPVKKAYNWENDAEETRLLNETYQTLRIPYIVTEEQLQCIAENGITKVRIEGYPNNIEFKTDAKKTMQSTIKFKERLEEMISQSTDLGDF